MSFRIFERVVWRKNPTWPEGYEPQAVPMDECPTIATVETAAEAIEYCDEHNDARNHLFESPYCEFTEE